MPTINNFESQLKFRDELAALINKYNLESVTGTPDHILANYLARCIDNFDQTHIERNRHSGTSNDSGSDSSSTH